MDFLAAKLFIKLPMSACASLHLNFIRYFYNLKAQMKKPEYPLVNKTEVHRCGLAYRRLAFAKCLQRQNNLALLHSRQGGVWVEALQLGATFG